MPKTYAHFGDKRALCTAVVTRGVLARIAQFNSEAPPEGTIEERLARPGIALLPDLGKRKDGADVVGRRRASPIWRAQLAGRRVSSGQKSLPFLDASEDRGSIELKRS